MIVRKKDTPKFMAKIREHMYGGIHLKQEKKFLEDLQLFDNI